jgi:transcriptional regulator with XRE-family HTH domain
MFEAMTMHAGAAAPSAGPGGIARAREAAGWSREELADVLGVSPMEVAALERDAHAFSPYQRAHFLWRIQHAHYERQLAEHSGCGWLPQHRAHLDELARRGHQGAGWAARRVLTHRAECALCQGAIRDLPPAPREPLSPGVRGRIAGLSPWLRLPVEAGVIGLWAAAVSGLFLALGA